MFSRSFLSVSLSLLLFCASFSASAACPGTQSILSRLAIVNSSKLSSPGPAYLFIGTGCTVMGYGPNPPTFCNAVKSTSPFPSGISYVAFFHLAFPDNAHNITQNGCTFACDGGANVCRVRGGDALPVELMDFSVQSEGN